MNGLNHRGDEVGGGHAFKHRSEGPSSLLYIKLDDATNK